MPQDTKKTPIKGFVQPSQVISENYETGEYKGAGRDNYGKPVDEKTVNDAKEVANARGYSENSTSFEAPKGKPNGYLTSWKDAAMKDAEAEQLEKYLGTLSGTEFFNEGLSQMYKKPYKVGMLSEKKLEDFIEKNPEKAVKALPEGSDIQKEAVEAVDGGKDAEVNNEVVKKYLGIEDKPYYKNWIYGEPGSSELLDAYNNVVKDYGKEEADEQLSDWGFEFRDGNVLEKIEESVKENDAEKLEQVIEENPKESSEVLPEGTPIQEEAIQVIDGGKDAEVRNDVTEDFVKNAGLLGGRKLNLEGTTKERTEAGRKDLEDIEDDQWKNNDFGIDYVPTKEERAALAEDNRHLPRKTDNDIEDEAEAIVESDEEDEEENKGGLDSLKKVGKALSRHKNISPYKGKDGDSFDTKGYSVGSSFGRTFSNGSFASGGASGAGKVATSADKTKASSGKSTNGVRLGGKASINETAKNETVESKGGGSQATKQSFSNGSFASGGTNKKGTTLAKRPEANLPNGEIKKEAEPFDQELDLRDAAIESIEKRIMKIQPELRKALGFEVKYSSVTYNGMKIEECPPEVLSDIEDILKSLGL